MNTTPVRVRFAPSPTGHLHIGGARTALFNWLFARHHGGTFILRIEDTDQSRLVPGSIEGLMAALKWLGLEPDEDPIKGGAYGPYIQSERLEIYQSHVRQLLESGHAYECYCSTERLVSMRAAQEAAGRPPGYDRHCRYLSPGERAAARATAATVVVRLAMPESGAVTLHDRIKGDVRFDYAKLDDHVLLKSDGFPTYHLAAIVDDHLMAISHVMRSEEWLPSTPKHLYLYQCFGWQPPELAHLPLVLDEQRKKMSKRRGEQYGYPVYVHEYQAMGILPEALINHLALLGWSYDETTELFTRAELVERFGLERVSPSGAIFSQEKLRWFNGFYINHVLSLEELAGAVGERLLAAGLIEPAALKPATPEHGHLLAVLALEKERLKLLTEVTELGYFFRDTLPIEPAALVPKRMTVEQAARALKLARMALAECDFASLSDENEPLSELLAPLGLKKGDLFMTIRVAITGGPKSPPLFDTLRVIGRQRVLDRLDRAQALLTVPGDR